MAQIANIVLKDGASAPVNHTFTPVTPQFGSNPAEWRERNVSVRLGDKVLTLSTVINSNDTRKVKGMIAYPEIVTVEGKPSILGIARVNFDVSVPPGMSVDVTKNLAAFFAEFAKNPILQSAITDGEIVY